ncbi:MAG: hypothetical protein ABR530_03495 [Pyrinomonadaceae bacterium]
MASNVPFTSAHSDRRKANVYYDLNNTEQPDDHRRNLIVCKSQNVVPIFAECEFAGMLHLIKGSIEMIDKSKIKVVKKTEAAATRQSKKKTTTSRMAAREMVSTVTDWVSDLKQRKSEETKAALDMLFVATPRTTGS